VVEKIFQALQVAYCIALPAVCLGVFGFERLAALLISFAILLSLRWQSASRQNPFKSNHIRCGAKHPPFQAWNFFISSGFP
jgi:hypothetical protein